MKRLKPILLGCSVLLLALCAIISLLAYLRRDDLSAIVEIFTLTVEQPYAEPLNTPDDILTYLRASPDAFGLVAYSVNPDGTPVEETIIAHNPDQPYTLASTFKIVVLAAYAREVSAGRIDPETPVPIAEWERFYLPDTDGGAHIAALNDLQITHDNGFAADTSATVTLDQIVGAMIAFSDNAATDVMLYRLGAETIAAAVNYAGGYELYKVLSNPNLKPRQKIFPSIGYGLSILVGVPAVILLIAGVGMLVPPFMFAASTIAVVRNIGTYLEERAERNNLRKELITSKELVGKIQKANFLHW